MKVAIGINRLGLSVAVAIVGAGCKQASNFADTPPSWSEVAPYARATKAVFSDAWSPPAAVEAPEARAKALVTIARDGKVVSAKLIEPSGNAAVDDSVRRVLTRVKFVAPFPPGMNGRKCTFTIIFNLKAKRQFG